jgi:hypothetical protein
VQDCDLHQAVPNGLRITKPEQRPAQFCLSLVGEAHSAL